MRSGPTRLCGSLTSSKRRRYASSRRTNARRCSPGSDRDDRNDPRGPATFVLLAGRPVERTLLLRSRLGSVADRIDPPGELALLEHPHHLEALDRGVAVFIDWKPSVGRISLP